MSCALSHPGAVPAQLPASSMVKVGPDTTTMLVSSPVNPSPESSPLVPTCSPWALTLDAPRVSAVHRTPHSHPDLRKQGNGGVTGPTPRLSLGRGLRSCTWSWDRTHVPRPPPPSLGMQFGARGSLQVHQALCRLGTLDGSCNSVEGPHPGLVDKPQGTGQSCMWG